MADRVLGIARHHRWTREADGAGRSMTAERCRARGDDVVVRCASSTSSNPAPPTNARTTARSPNASSGHLRETNVAAVIGARPRGTTKPLASGSASAVPDG